MIAIVELVRNKSNLDPMAAQPPCSVVRTVHCHGWHECLHSIPSAVRA